jgi:hypothetical protein
MYISPFVWICKLKIMLISHGCPCDAARIVSAESVVHFFTVSILGVSWTNSNFSMGFLWNCSLYSAELPAAGGGTATEDIQRLFDVILGVRYWPVFEHRCIWDYLCLAVAQLFVVIGICLLWHERRLCFGCVYSECSIWNSLEMRE